MWLLVLAEAEDVRVLTFQVFIESLRLILIFQISKILKLELARIFRLFFFFISIHLETFQVLATLRILQLSEGFLINSRWIPNKRRRGLLPQQFLDFLWRQLALWRIIILTAT